MLDDEAVKGLTKDKPDIVVDLSEGGNNLIDLSNKNIPNENANVIDIKNLKSWETDDYEKGHDLKDFPNGEDKKESKINVIANEILFKGVKNWIKNKHMKNRKLLIIFKHWHQGTWQKCSLSPKANPKQK